MLPECPILDRVHFHLSSNLPKFGSISVSSTKFNIFFACKKLRHSDDVGKLEKIFVYDPAMFMLKQMRSNVEGRRQCIPVSFSQHLAPLSRFAPNYAIMREQHC